MVQVSGRWSIPSLPEQGFRVETATWPRRRYHKVRLKALKLPTKTHSVGLHCASRVAADQNGRAAGADVCLIVSSPNLA